MNLLLVAGCLFNKTNSPYDLQEKHFKVIIIKADIYKSKLWPLTDPIP